MGGIRPKSSHGLVYRATLAWQTMPFATPATELEARLAMFDERNVLAALAVLLCGYALIGLLALSARGGSITPWFRRRLRRLLSRRDDATPKS